MKDRNFVKEIEKLRTAVLGYDREEVVLYIRELVEYYGQKNEEAVRELYLEKMQLAAENAGLRAQIPTQEKLYAEAEGKAEEILGGAKETAATILDHAGAEKERMLKEAEEDPCRGRPESSGDHYRGRPEGRGDTYGGREEGRRDPCRGRPAGGGDPCRGRETDGRHPDKDKGESGEATGALPSVPQPSGSLEKRPGLHLCRVSAGGKHTGSAWKAAETGTDTGRRTGRGRSPGTAMNGGEQYSLDVALLKIREEKRKRKMRTERTAILFVVWLLVFRVCGIMRVDGNSMRPACHPGDIVFFLRILPDGVGYGDAVILKDASGEYLIKRIAGLPGDVMEVDREGHLTRNGAEVQETDVIFGLSETGDSVEYPYTVPEGSYFFLGDNRPVSMDSRTLGAAGKEEIKGKVIWAAGAGRWNKKTGKR